MKYKKDEGFEEELTFHTKDGLVICKKEHFPQINLNKHLNGCHFVQKTLKFGI